ncbi:hypothetical protein QVD17_13982 [Tagetes erecta]|uniref:RING-type domain-containing protein n=1 Tax=Tagetes erecta TaxID=13708 RepID=A0AAD8L156_TARER|nr:hypothetical protein QVD17_13982 [Tagetes erecta]
MAIQPPPHHHLTLYPPFMIIDAIDNRLGNIYPTLHPFSPETIPDLVKLADSNISYSNLPVCSRKRSRDDCSSMCDPFSVARNHVEDVVSSQIRQQQFEIDQIVAQHVEKVRCEIEERRRRNSRRLIETLEEGITQTLRSKEEEIMKMMKLNYAMEEKLKSLCIENQIWRELAQSNEATANALRSNLKQVLEQLVNNNSRMAAGDDNAVDAVDAQSCCESNNYNETGNSNSNSNMKRGWCKSCGKAESCVVLLPCRHLCLCTVCASSVDTCPVCKSFKNISVHVHMS